MYISKDMNEVKNNLLISTMLLLKDIFRILHQLHEVAFQRYFLYTGKGREGKGRNGNGTSESNGTILPNKFKISVGAPLGAMHSRL